MLITFLLWHCCNMNVFRNMTTFSDLASQVTQGILCLILLVPSECEAHPYSRRWLIDALLLISVKVM